MSTSNICKGTQLSNCERTATAVISDYYTSKQPQFGGYVIIWWNNFANTLNLRHNNHHWHFFDVTSLVVTRGHSRSFAVTCHGQSWSFAVTRGHSWSFSRSFAVTRGYLWSLVVTHRCHSWPLAATRGNSASLVVTRRGHSFWSLVLTRGRSWVLLDHIRLCHTLVSTFNTYQVVLA